jgi:hypothetical protein
MLASDISYKHVGKTFRSLVYPNKNKTAKPKSVPIQVEDGTVVYIRCPQQWTLKSFQFFDNGNIIVNQGWFYLRPDTEVEIIDGA